MIIRQNVEHEAAHLSGFVLLVDSHSVDEHLLGCVSSSSFAGEGRGAGAGGASTHPHQGSGNGPHY